MAPDYAMVILHRNPSKRLGGNKLKLNSALAEMTGDLAPLYMKSQTRILLNMKMLLRKSLQRFVWEISLIPGEFSHIQLMCVPCDIASLAHEMQWNANPWKFAADGSRTHAKRFFKCFKPLQPSNIVLRELKSSIEFLILHCSSPRLVKLVRSDGM